MMSITRQQRRMRVALRGVCIATITGLTLATVPSIAAASPTTLQAPILPQLVVGLRQGASGADVVALQKALIAAGVTVPGGADGFFGPATKSALTAFQSRSGLATTGEVDAASAAALGLAPAPNAPSATNAAQAVNGLTLGAKGDAVKELQRALMAFGVFVPGGADGIFGPATKTAVTNLQRWNGLTVTGVVDAPTAKLLKLGSAPAAPASPAPVPAASAPNGNFVGMKIGARGENVKVLQRALIAAGITVRGGADGIFGSMTDAALKTYQQRNGLTADGIVSAAVVTKLGLVAGAPAPAPAPGPTPPAGAAHVGLKVGSTGALVKDLQRALMQTGLTLRGGADGVFGNMTRATLVAFQQAQGRPQTGIVTAADARELALGTGRAPTGVSNPAGYPVYGERGARVKALQQSLIRAGITFAGGADGVFGAATSGAILAFQRREGLPATGKVDQATATRLGSTAAPAPAPPSTAGVSLDVFPVQGQCWFGDTWHAPRGGGRLHEGVDVIAARGKLLYAVTSGRISKVYTDTAGSLAGNGLRLSQDNGTYFTYLHMDRFAPGIALGTPVVAGQVIGTVGSTGASATPHLHFEVHPGGGAAVNPYPMIKRIDACNVTAPR